MSIYRIANFFILCRLCFLCYYSFICHFFLFIILHFWVTSTSTKSNKICSVDLYTAMLSWVQWKSTVWGSVKSDMVGKLLRIEEGNDWKYSHMVGKSLTWSGNYSGWKATNSNMVGNFPQGVRKGVPSHRTFSLVHPSYRREFPILFSISVKSQLWREGQARGL